MFVLEVEVEDVGGTGMSLGASFLMALLGGCFS